MVLFVATRIDCHLDDDSQASGVPIRPGQQLPMQNKALVGLISIGSSEDTILKF